MSPIILLPRGIEGDDENESSSANPTELDAPDDGNHANDTRSSPEDEEPEIDSKAIKGMLGAFDDGVEQPNEWRELRWILFKEVGGKVSKCTDVGELVQVFNDSTLGACGSLCPCSVRPTILTSSRLDYFRASRSMGFLHPAS
jgi:hypothetical protein